MVLNWKLHFFKVCLSNILNHVGTLKSLMTKCSLTKEDRSILVWVCRAGISRLLLLVDRHVSLETGK